MKTKLSYIFIQILVGICTVVSLGQANAGGLSGGGGGTSVYYKGQHVLLDLLILGENHRPGVWHLDNSEQDPVAIANQVLKAWDEKIVSFSSMTAGSAFHEKNIKWVFISDTLPLAQRYYIPDQLKSELSDIKTTAYYSKENGGYSIHISKPVFTELDMQNQVATIIHESLRHYQIGWDKNNGYFDERSLQEATAIYMLCRPKNVLAMYVNYILGNKRAEAEKFFGPLNEVLNKYCQEPLW